MTKRIRNLFVAILSCLLVAVTCVGMVSLVKADVTVITMTGTAEANVKTAEKSGLRFSAVINKSEYQTLTQDKDAKVGMIIVPTDHLNAAISQGLDFTIEKLSTYAPFEGYAFYDYAETVKDNGDEYQFWMTVPNISGANYNRDFSARAFIELTDGNSVSYVYADYDAENARNVYEVAYSAYTDGTIEDQTGKEIAKTFIDGVAVLEYDTDKDEVVIANNKGEYTSPYEVVINSDGTYSIRNAKAIIYKNQRVTSLKLLAEQEGITLNKEENSGATYNNGQVTLAGGDVNGMGWYSGLNNYMTNSYVAFEGDYGVGTFIDFYFSGNNMPQVCLFANNINGNMASDADQIKTDDGNGGNIITYENPKNTGYLLVNGMYNKATSQIIRGDRICLFGPNRMNSDAHYNDNSIVNNCTVSSLKTYFTQNGLIGDYADGNYKYTVGTYIGDDGFVYVKIAMAQIIDGMLVELGEAQKSTGQTKDDIESLGGNIIAYACVKGKGNDTVFSYSAPYKALKSYVITNDSTPLVDNKISLDGQVLPGIGWNSDINQKYTSKYLAFAGNYGVGTYVNFYFTGNNMPQVALFANNINGNIANGAATADGTPVNTGFVLFNGMTTSTQSYSTDRLVCTNQNRMDGTCRYNYTTTDMVDRRISSELCFTQDGLSSTFANRTLKYVVGSYVESEVVYIHAIMYDAITGYCLGEAVKNTGLTVSNAEALGSNIIAFACVKGAGDNTVFTYDDPYKSDKIVIGSGLAVSGANFNQDGTISLASRYPTNGYAWFSSVHSTLNNSYIAFKGDYGVGTYVDFTFTGNNLPQVCLFANTINGDMSQGGATSSSAPENTGYLIMNGMWYKNGETEEIRYPNYLICFGPYRQGGSVTEYKDINYTAGQWSTVRENMTITTDANFRQTTLVNNVNQLKYTVGTYLDEDSTIIIQVSLYDLTNSKSLVTEIYDTNKTESDMQALGMGTNIIAYGCCKGGTEPTTFTFSEPRTNNT